MTPIDPLFADGVDGGVLLIVLLKTAICFATLLIGVMLMVWFERKVISDFQNRVGPNKAGPWGLLQTLADGLKLFFKEDALPGGADKRIFRIAPYLSATCAFLSFAIIPIGGIVTIAGHETRLQLVEPPIGILLLLACSSIAVYGIMLAGWASGSKYPLLGSVRASAQMVSYEAALGLSIAAVVLISGSLVVGDIVDAQRGGVQHWNVIRLGLVPFLIFAVAATAELNRPPFDLVEAEQELVAGYQTEYASMRFAMFYLAEYMGVVTMSAVMVTLFFGGPNGPRIDFLSWLWPIVWFMAKLVVFLFAYVWVRATLPRFRYDQLMDLGWKKLIPVSLAWLLIVAAMLQSRTAGIAVFVGCLVAAAALYQSMKVGRSRYDEVGYDEFGDPTELPPVEPAKETVS